MKSRFRVLTPAAGAAAVTIAALATGAAVLALLLGPAPLHADWIVTRQGERFEIQGTWQLKGKLMVFTLPNGTLSSLRADRVDIDASKQTTAQAKQQAAAPPPAAKAEPKRKAVIVLTDKDFKKPLPDGAAPAPNANAAAGAKATDKDNPPPATGPPSAVEVVSWERVPANESKANGVELTGTVRNTSQDNLTEVTVVADLFDDGGGLIGRFPAVVDNQQLPPTESSKFHLVANGVVAFGAIRWETTSKGIRSVQGAPAPPPH
ncbi:MAG TPA: FxLYD domain-containing protein [Thermoanaerobaculia bacterium]